MWRKGAICAVVVGLGACNWAFGLKAQTPPDAPDAPPPDAAIPPSSWASVTGAFLHSCGIRVDQTLWCWGRNDAGQLGIPGDVEDDLPAQVGTDRWLSVTTAEQHTCAIKLDHTLWCWGENNTAQLGQPASPTPNPTPTQVGSLAWKSVSTGAGLTCAIDVMDALWCWGANDRGQLGNSMADTNSDHSDPVLVDGGATWSSVATGDVGACGIHTDGTVFCWGYGAYGVRGQGVSSDSSTPMQVGTDHYSKISLGHETVCALRVDGELLCWGEGDHGELGNDDVGNELSPVDVQQDQAKWSDVTVAGFHACGLHQDLTLWCWGDNPFGQLGVDTPTAHHSTIPVAVPSPDGGWLAIAAGDNETCAIGADHQLWCAGLNSGALGTADGGSRVTPVQVGMAAVVSAGGDTTCAIDAGGGLTCWGLNNVGQVGDGTTLNRQSAVTVTGNLWTAVAPAPNHTCGIANGTLECWGTGGQLGNNPPSASTVPVPAAALVPGAWTAVVSNDGSCAIAGGIPYCWGDNTWGEGGQSTIGSPILTPTQVSMTVSGWTEIATGFTHSCGLDTSGIQCWGNDGVGELTGFGGGPTSTAPLAGTVVPGTTFDHLTVGGYHSCARVDGTFWCWGYDLHGELGNGATTVSGPFMLPDPYLQVSAGDAFTCGVRPDRTLWCWGANEFGQLGVGKRLEHHEAAMVNADTDWAAVSAGSQHACAMKLDRRLFCWGRNLEGEVGDGKTWRSTLEVVP